MAISLTTSLRNTLLNTIESTAGNSAKLRIYSSPVPADANATITGTLLVDIALPSDWMAAADGGVKSLLGSWTNTNANATGTAAYFRILNNAADTTYMQGTVGTSGSDLNLSSTSIVLGGTVTITGFTLTAGNP